MSLTLNTNVSSLNTQNWLTTNSATLSKATQQLSSGYQLNSAADDPAGYAIAFKLGTKSAVLQTAINNANQGTAMLQVAQGAMQQIGNILTQLKQTRHRGGFRERFDQPPTSLDNERAALQTQIDNINTSTPVQRGQCLRHRQYLRCHRHPAYRSRGSRCFRLIARPRAPYTP